MSRSRYVAIAMQPVHRLQISPIVPPTTSSSYIRVRAIVWACGRKHRQTHRHTDAHDHNTLSHATCNKTVAPRPSSKLDFKFDTRYRVSHAVASRTLTAGWLSCCYSRWATTQYMTPAVCTLTESMRREEEENEEWK